MSKSVLYIWEEVSLNIFCLMISIYETILFVVILHMHLLTFKIIFSVIVSLNADTVLEDEEIVNYIAYPVFLRII